jgi:hypothetical protein
MVIDISAKNIRNGILVLVILAIGIKIILYITGKYINFSAAGDMGTSLNETGNFFIYGALIIAILLVPFYLSARSNEKKEFAL